MPGRGRKKRTKSQQSPNSVSSGPDTRRPRVNGDQMTSPQNTMSQNLLPQVPPYNGQLQGQMQGQMQGGYYTPPATSQQYINQLSPGTQQNAMIDTNFQQTVLNKLEFLGNKMQKLDSIEKQLATMSQKMTHMDTRVSSLESSVREHSSKLIDLETSRTVDSQIVTDLEKTQKKESENINKMSRDYESLKRQNANLSNEILDLQFRSMRDNLLFFGFDECDSVENRKTENCTEKILNFCSDTLEITDAQTTIKIERAHRIGQYNHDKKRPIVVKFNHYPDKLTVKQQAAEKL